MNINTELDIKRIVTGVVYGLCLLLLLATCAIVSGCGGGSHQDTKYQLQMTQSSGELEKLYIYETANDCISAGSYRVLAFPQKYVAYSCQEV